MKDTNLAAHVLAVQSLLSAAQEQGVSPAEVLGQVLHASKSTPQSMFCPTLRRATAVCISETIKELLPRYLSLYDALVSRGISQKTAQEVGSDSYIYYLPEKTFETSEARRNVKAAIRAHLNVPKLSPEQELEFNKCVVRPFVLTTQGENYLIVLSLRYGEWSLHIRQFWEDLNESLNSNRRMVLEEYRSRKNLSLKDLVVLAKTASDEYSDAFPGNTHVWRPSLTHILSRKLVPHDVDTSSALFLGDCRDAGYIVSYDSRTGVDADGPEWFGTGQMKNVIDRLATAMDILELGAPVPVA